MEVTDAQMDKLLHIGNRHVKDYILKILKYQPLGIEGMSSDFGIEEFSPDEWYEIYEIGKPNTIIRYNSVPQSSYYGFQNGVWCSNITDISLTYSTFFRAKRLNWREVQSMFSIEAKSRGYTKENIIPVSRTIDDGFSLDIDRWAVFSDMMYTMPDGEGGCIVYKHGVWASKRE